MPFYDSYHDNIIINGPIIESNHTLNHYFAKRRSREEMILT
jgi:hypothetical protein